jgi:hypothetical protein
MSSASQDRRVVTSLCLLALAALVAVVGGLLVAYRKPIAESFSPSDVGFQTKATNQTLDKLHGQLLRQWKAATDQAKDDWRNGKAGSAQTALTELGLNPNEARRVYVQMRQQQEFPTNFTEATSPVVYRNANGQDSLAPLPYYVNRLWSPGPDDPTYQSSVCLYLALIRARRGEVSNIEDAIGLNALQEMNGARVFVDAWGTPISYTRNGNGQVSSAGPNRIPGDEDDLSSLATRDNTRGD